MPELKTIQIPSSKGGGVFYEVQYSDDLTQIECVCPAYFYRMKCRHVVEAREVLQQRRIKPGSEPDSAPVGGESGGEMMMKGWDNYRRAVEQKTAERSLKAAFVAGAEAALQVVSESRLFRCPVCGDQAVEQLEREIDSMKAGAKP